MLHITCALQPEARPLTAYFELRPVTAAPGICHNSDSNISLTVSGIGKSAAAAAVARTQAHFKADRTHAWLNLGIAGHASLPLGQAVIIKKVTEAATGQSWYPPCVFNTALPARDLLTLDRPGDDYQQELFDMECSGYFRAASDSATAELIQAVKIVSDNAEQPMARVNPALISRLTTRNLPALEEIIQQLLALSKLLQRLGAPAPDYHTLIAQRRFTASQRHQLRALLRKWQARRPGDTALSDRLTEQKSAAAVLRFLQDELDQMPVSLTVERQ